MTDFSLNKMKFELRKAKIIGNTEGSQREFVAGLGKGRYVKLFSDFVEILHSHIGKEFKVLYNLHDSNVYGGKTLCGKLISDHTHTLPEEHQKTARELLYSNQN